MPSRRDLARFALVALLTALGVLYVDAAVASWSYRLISAIPVLSRHVTQIPDLLVWLVLLITAGCWTAYLIMTAAGVRGARLRFLRVCGTCVPAAYCVKAVLQIVFGRSSAFDWVLFHQPPTFHWLKWRPNYGGFPSGHMTVFSAVATVLSYYYPRYKGVYLGLLALLGLALIVTTYHFVSDVIAGAYVGAVACSLIHRAVEGPGREGG